MTSARFKSTTEQEARLNPNQIVISNFLPNLLPGDFNHDGIVNAADHVFWREPDLGPAAYNIWRQNFGRTAAIGTGGGAASAARS